MSRVLRRNTQEVKVILYKKKCHRPCMHMKTTKYKYGIPGMGVLVILQAVNVSMNM